MSRKQKKRALSILLMISMIVSSISTKPIPAYASSVDGSHIHYSSDELVAEFNFGTDVTKDTVYSPDLGYGFTTVKYPDPAPGWVGGVYYPREQAVSYSSDYVNPVIDETDASENIIPGSGSDKDDNGDTVSGSAVNVTTASGPAVHVVTEPAPTDTNVNTVTGPAIGVLEIGSVVWTETESSGYGVYTYENTSVFNVDLENADYNVTVTLVNPTDTEYSAYLKAEDITKDSGITVAPGATVERTITAILIDGQLNLKFLATSSATQENLATRGNVYVSKVSIVRQATNEVTDKPTIFLASDSTVQTYDDYYYPQTGWGQTLYHFFGEFIEERECTDCDYSQAQTYETNNVVIENRAIGGRSSKSFIIEGKLDDLLEDVKPGDYVLVQWGHNDATYSRPNRYVSVAEFPEMLKYYIDGARQRGATPILITPVARYSPRADGTFNSDFEGYRQAMITLGGEMNVPVLDLTAASLALCEALGVEGAKSLFLHLAAGDYEGAYAGGATDSTHLQYYGAYKFAQCVAKLILDYSVDNQLDTLKSYVELKMPTTLPEAVSNLVTTTIGATSISFSWDAGDGSELYYIYRAELTTGMTIDDIDFTTAEKYSVSPVARYTDKNCESGKVYVYAVRGFNEFGLGELSDKILVSTKSALYKFDFDNSATDPVMEGWTQVTASQMYDEGLGYGWIVAPNNGRYRGNNGNADSSDMADDFCLGYGEFALDLPNGDYEVKIYAGDLLPGTSTIKASYSAEGASIGGISARQSIGTTVSVVRVVDGQLNVTVEGSNPYINGMEITPLLLAPSNLSYSEFEFKGTNAEFLINFDGISEAVEYRIYQKSTTDTQYSLVKVIAAADKDNLDSRAMVARIGETREYYVVAVLADGTETAPSLPIIIEMVDPNAPKPAAPTNLRCVSASKANIHIEWDAVDGAIYYNIYRSDKAEGTKGFNGFVKVGESSVASFIDTDNDVIPNIHYYYKVEAVGIGGIGPKSIALITPITEALVRTKAENLTDRALVAVDLAGDKGAEVNVTTKDAEGNELTSGVFLSWRLFEDDPEDVTFTVYKNGQVIASDLTVTNCVDPSGTAADTYMVVGSSDADLGLSGLATATWQNYYLELQLQKPEDQILPDGTISTYTANDMSVGDLDNDGQYELIVKWYPSASKDNAHSGYTGTTILDAYDIDTATGEATLMWRIDLGVNIRSGAHYTQFQVWDFDGDGRAEIVCKTADGTTTYQNINGTLVETGYVGACSASSLPTDTISSVNDYRNSSGYVLDGPEYLTIFDGETGAIIDTTDYIPARGNVAAWGDAYGNRVDRFLSAVAYLDGQKASAVFARGYYTRSCITAYDFIDTDDDGRGDKLVVRWAFDTNDYPVSEYGVTEGQGNHNIAINDVDNDGKDEIIYGAMVVDHDGSLKYVTGLGHGDAMHISDWIPSRPGLEIFSVHENGGVAYQVEVHDAETGEIIWGYHTGQDTGRGVAADIDPTHEGAEFWASVSWDGTNGGIYSSKSTLDNFIQLSQRTPSVNFTLFWDGDLLSELQDHSFNEAAYVPISTNITKWNYMTQTSETLFESTEVHTSNGTKGNVGLVADIIGDWREEIIARSSADDSKVRIYTTTIITDYTIPCLMDNSAYRIGIAWQNVGYNQPANLDYLISEGLETSTLKAGDIKVNSATIIFTEASDGKYGHEVAGYEVYRATEGGEYVLIDTLSLDDLIEVTLDGEPIAEPVEYKFDFGASVLQDGWIQIDSSSPSYETNGTYGFTNETLALGLTEKAYGFDTANELYAMYTDCLLGWNASSPFEFVVNVPNGTYEVTFYTFNGSGDQYNQITIEDIKMDDIRRGRNDNGPTERSAIIEVTDGTVNVINQSSKSNGFAIYFSGLTIKQIVEETEPDIDTKIYYGYTDDTVDSDTTYSYSIAAIVNGRRSFMSNPVTIKTLVSISEILDFQLPDIVEGTPLPEGGSLADLLPAFLDVIDNNGNNTIADVIWDVSELDITTPGNYSVKGIIPGYTKILEKTVTVVPNEIILYEFEGYARVGDEEPYYTKNTVLNTIDLDLPETVIFKYLNGTTEEVAVIWDTSEIDITNKGSYLAVGTTAPLASSGGKFGEQTVKMKVEVKDDFISEFDNLPRIEGVIGSTVEEFIAGLPATLRAIYKSGNIQDVPVKWNTDNITDELLASEQVFNITGTVENYSGTITLPVYVDYKVVWRFDFGISTDDVEEGWTGVTVNGKGGGKTLEELGSVYTPEKGYGFADGTAITEGRHEGYTFEGPLPPLVYRDFVLPDGQTFLVDVPNGTYIVEYSSGSYYRSKVSLVIEDTYSSSTSNGEQTYNIGKVVDVIITDGQMNIFFPTGNTSRLNAIIIRQVSVDDVEDPTPTPIPEDPTPTPIPEDPTPTPIPEDPTPTPIPEDPTPTPIPEDPTPTPIPEDPTPTPIPEDPTPTPIPEDPTPTPVPEDPTPIPTATPTPTPTPTPVVVDEVTVDGLDGKIRYSILDGVEDGRINIITELPLDQILKTASEKDTEEALNVTVPISSQQIVGLMKQDEAKDVNVILKLSKDVLEHEDLQLNIQLDRILLQTSKDENKNITVSVVDEYNKERYSWTFTGDNLSKSSNDITDINLSLEVASVTSDTDIWDLLEEKHRGENGLVLNFGHSGQLPAQASVRIYVGDREGFKPGDRIYLYHYNKSNGLLETLPYSSNYVIDKDGYITVDLVHCSDYVVLPKEADSSIILSLREQIAVTPKEEVIYLGGTVDNTTKIDVTLPVTLEQVENIGDPTSSSAIGAVTVKFTSSNEKVATVDRDGNIRAQGTGIAVIRTKITLYSGKTKTFNTIIYVRKPYIKITQSTETMKVGDSFTFEAKGYGVAEEDIQWLTTKKSIVVIGKNSGKATAESKGTDYVVAKAGDLTKQIKVVVK